jgi:hypothetical protein
VPEHRRLAERRRFGSFITTVAVGSTIEMRLRVSKAGRAMGSSAVAGMGIASVIHHVAMSSPTPATTRPSGVSPDATFPVASYVARGSSA